MKYTPKENVINRTWSMCFRLPSIRLWWAQVIDTPEANNTEVLSSGTSRELRGIIPVGGQQPPNSGVGARLEW